MNLTASPFKDQTPENPTSNICLEWFLEASEGSKEFFYLVSAADPKRPMLLHLGENFEQDGDPITLVEKNKAYENTKLRFDEVPGLDGYYYMSFVQSCNMGSRSTDSKRVVHLDEETKRITQWEKIQASSCYWRLVPARVSPLDMMASDEHNCFAFENKACGFMNLKGGSIFNGTQLTASQFANQTNFKWRIKRVGSGDQYYIITARDAHHDRALQQHDNVMDDGAKVTLWEVEPGSKSTSAMVKFEPIQDDNGCWGIVLCHSNKYLQMRLGELSQVGRRRNQPLEPSCCWTFVRCIPNFPKNA